MVSYKEKCLCFCVLTTIVATIFVISSIDLNYHCGGYIDWPSKFTVRNETRVTKTYSIIEDDNKGEKIGEIERSSYIKQNYQIVDNTKQQVFRSEKDIYFKTVHTFYNCSSLMYTVEKVNFNFDLNFNKFEIKNNQGDIIAISEKTRDSSFNLRVSDPNNENIYYATMYKQNKSRFNVEIYPSNPINPSVYALIIHHIFQG